MPEAVPDWAKVSDAQKAAAKEAGVPVAFENAIGMRFVLIPAGTFLMGSPATEEGRDGDEVQHEVVLTKPFYLGVTEVTNAQYRRFRADHDSGAYKDEGLNGDDQPVVRVSWDDAVAFAEWLSGQDGGRTYRLPTEAEWEWACRAGTRTRYWWGDAEEEGWKYANANDPKTKEAFGFDWDGWPKDDGLPRDGAGGVVPAEPVGTVRHARERVGVVRGLVRGVPDGAGDGSLRDRATGRRACCAAAPGASHRGSFARRAASGSTPASGPTTSASVSSLRCPRRQKHRQPRPARGPNLRPRHRLRHPPLRLPPAPRRPRLPARPSLRFRRRASRPTWSPTGPRCPTPRRRPRRRPASRWRSRTRIGMRFVLIPAGTFQMGSPPTEEGRDDDEAQHEVVLTKPFYLGVTEVTNAQYRRFRADHDSGAFEGRGPERGRPAGGEGVVGRRGGVRGVAEAAGGGADVPAADGGGVGVGVPGGDADEVLVGGRGGGGVEVRERERPEDEGGVRVRRGTGGRRTTGTG